MGKMIKIEKIPGRKRKNEKMEYIMAEYFYGCIGRKLVLRYRTGLSGTFPLEYVSFGGRVLLVD